MHNRQIIQSLIVKLICMIYFASMNVLAISENNEVLKNMLKFRENPNAYIFDYTTSPSQMHINKENIKDLTVSNSYSNNDAKSIRDSFDKRPEYKFKDGLLNDSKKFIANSADITRGTSNSEINCNTKKTCEIEYTSARFCTAPAMNKTYKCEQELIVDVDIPKKINKRIRIEVSMYSKSAGGVTYDIRNKKVLSYRDATTLDIKQDHDLSDVTCENFNIRVVDENLLPGTHQNGVSRVVSVSSDCQKPILSVSVDQADYKNKYNKYKTRGVYVIIEVGSESAPLIYDRLDNNCPEIDRRVRNGVCFAGDSVCISKKETRTINGVEVTRDCWRYKTKFQCGASESSLDSCKEFDSPSCVQLSSECAKYIDGICTIYSKSYKCALNDCSESVNVSCGEGNVMQNILDKYTPTSQVENSDFAESMTKLSVIADAVKAKPSDISESTEFIFSGRAMECSKSALGFKDCCKDSGWGVDLNLISCSDEEKELGKKKENNQAVYIGKNKHDEGGRIDKRYCVFDSKLAKLIQEHGRQSQLQIGFGTAKNPNCRGLSPKELAAINLDLIDLTSAFTDSIPQSRDMDISKTENDMKDRIRKHYTDEVGNA